MLKNFDEYIFDYLIHWYNINFSFNLKNIFLNIFHLWIIIFILLGPFLPHKLLGIYIILMIINITSWFLFDGCVLQILKQTDKKEFIPLSKKTVFYLISTLLSFATIGYFYPNCSLFSLFYRLFVYLNNNYN